MVSANLGCCGSAPTSFICYLELNSTPHLSDSAPALSAPPTSPKKRLVAPTLSVTLSHGDPAHPHADGWAGLSASPEETPSLDINLEALETPSGSETGTLPGSLHELEWEGEAASDL